MSIEGAAAELPYLETFAAVCAEGGITAAARRLGCTQPAVSYQIRKLETLLGVQLLERSGRRLVITPEGRRFRAYADRVLTDLAQVRRECAAGEVSEPLRLGSASGFGRYVLLPALHALRAEQPDPAALEVRLTYEAADVVLDRLEAGEFEAAFVYKRRVSSGLVHHMVYEEELVLIAAAEWVARASGREVERLEGIEALPFVTYEECEYVFGRWFDTCFGTQPARLSSRSHFTDLEEVIDFVTRGVGISVVPKDAVEGALARGEVGIVRAGTGGRCLNPVYRVQRAGSGVRPMVERLTALLTR